MASPDYMNHAGIGPLGCKCESSLNRSCVAIRTSATPESGTNELILTYTMAKKIENKSKRASKTVVGAYRMPMQVSMSIGEAAGRLGVPLLAPGSNGKKGKQNRASNANSTMMLPTPWDNTRRAIGWMGKFWCGVSRCRSVVLRPRKLGKTTGNTIG